MPTFTIASWNVNSINVRHGQVLDWIKNNPNVDVLFIEETKVQAEKFPHEDYENLGFSTFVVGQKTYNGVALLVKKSAVSSIEDVTYNLPNYKDTQARFISCLVTLSGGKKIRLAAAYVPNGKEAGSIKYLYKLDWLSHLHLYLSREKENLVLGGDFNIAPEDIDIWDTSGFKLPILTTSPERAALERLMTIGLFDTFRAKNTEPKQFSWWDYKANSFNRNAGIRIDLILASNSLRENLVDAFIDKTPRGNTQPSDHTPVLATFSF